MNSFTPGPWWNSNHGILKMPEQIKIVNSVGGATIEEAKANSKLIAKAPEMYDILKDLLENHILQNYMVDKIKELLGEIDE